MSSTEALDRLVALFQALTAEWQDRADLMMGLAYPPGDSARVMFDRDIVRLRALGFVVERSPELRSPAFRLAGHTRWPDTLHDARWQAKTLGLTPLQAHIYALRTEEHLAFSQIATHMGRTRHTVMQIFYRAQRKVRRSTVTSVKGQNNEAAADHP